MEYKMENQKKNKKWLLVVGAGLLSCLMLSLGVFAGYWFLRTPLGEPLNLTYRQPTAVLAVAATPTPAVAVAPTQTVEVPAPAQPANTGICGSTGTLTVLLTGSDVTGGVEPRGADAVRLVKVDYDRQKITVVAFPRDLWVNTPGLGDLQIGQTRLGLAYYERKEATNGTEKHRIMSATTLLAQTLYDNFAVEPQNYFTLEMKNIPNMISAVGGVEVNVPENFVSDYRVSFAGGPQLMDGPRAYEFIRTYNPGGDAARLRRQNLFLKGLQTRVINTEILPRLPELLNQFDNMLFTDLNPQQLATLGCAAKEIPQEQIFFHEIGGDLVTKGSNFVLYPDVEKIKAKLHEWLAD